MASDSANKMATSAPPTLPAAEDGHTHGFFALAGSGYDPAPPSVLTIGSRYRPPGRAAGHEVHEVKAATGLTCRDGVRSSTVSRRTTTPGRHRQRRTRRRDAGTRL